MTKRCQEKVSVNGNGMFGICFFHAATDPSRKRPALHLHAGRPAQDPHLSARAGEPYRADARRETTEAKVRRILNEELAKLGWAQAELEGRAKGDARKIRIARRSRAETAVTLKWIATELQMGTWTHVANRLSNNSAQTINQPDLNLCQK